MLLRTRIIVIALLLAPLAARAQGPARYHAPPDTVWVEQYNPFRMYWVRGTDTIGSPVRALSLVAESWASRGERLEVVTHLLRLSTDRTVRHDTLTLLPGGAVAEVNHRPPTLNGMLDFVLRLPAAQLAPGVAWADSISQDSAGKEGRDEYTVRRTLRVVRMVDSLGGRLAEVRGEGTVKFRYSFWADSAAGQYAWVDVAGPVRETFLFDVSRGRQVSRMWDMDLRGTGALPGPRGMDTLPAGLLSREYQRVVSPERAHLLGRELPGRDTSETIAGGRVLLHTVERGAAAVRSAMARNDGLVGTAESEFAGGRATRYVATWTDTAAATVTQHVTAGADGLRVRRSGARDTTLALPPDGVWGIADYAMEEHLVPVLMTVTPGQPVPVHVYRPTPGRWDHGMVAVTRVAGVVVASMQMAGENDPELLVITPDGDLLRRPPQRVRRRAPAARGLRAPRATGGRAQAVQVAGRAGHAALMRRCECPID